MTEANSMIGLGVVEEAVVPASRSLPACFHCGTRCLDDRHRNGSNLFCCNGCLLVHDLLSSSGLGRYYELGVTPGTRVGSGETSGRWDYLDDGEVWRKLVDFEDGRTARVTLHVPSMHCLACVWLLENLFRLGPGIGSSVVNFPRREVSVSWDLGRTSLSKVVGLLASIGYEPVLTLGELDRPVVDHARRRLSLRVGIAGFAFGNVMLFSLPQYFGLDTLNGPLFRTVFGVLSLLLALPVVTYSAGDFWRAAWLCFRHRMLTLDVPIAAGLAALYLQSAWEILSHRGEGYLDSLCGLVFFLLCGRVFQQKSHERLVFDRDYRCFFPLAVRRKGAGGLEESVAISRLAPGDLLVLRNGELIPADCVVRSGEAQVDYSFVTGESDPVTREVGDRVYAGGRQIGGALELEMVKPVSESYLTSLWNHDAFRKQAGGLEDLDTQTNRYGRRFTRLVLVVALGSALGWSVLGHDVGRGMKAFASVLIVACPCALALAAPFTLGTAQRLLGRWGVHLKNGQVLERMAALDTIVLDKTGTLTSAGASGVVLHGDALGASEAAWVLSVARQSTHPHSVRIREVLEREAAGLPVEAFVETPGCGVEGVVAGHQIRLGSATWLQGKGIKVPSMDRASGGVVHLAVDGRHRGVYLLQGVLRPDVGTMLRQLSARHSMILLSGDHAGERARYESIFGAGSRLHFNQTPVDKLEFVRGLQSGGGRVMMVGDGLNDSGALRQSDVGVAVVERTGVFSPASDVILEGRRVPRLGEILDFSRDSARIVRLSFAVSAAYNAVGIGIAAYGILSPVVCAILMPLSSVTVVAFAVGATTWAARRRGLIQSEEESEPRLVPGGGVAWA